MKKVVLSSLLLVCHFVHAELIIFEQLMQTSGLSAQEIFEKNVLQSTLPVVINFSATWCPACISMGPLFAALARDANYIGKITFIKVNYDACKDIAQTQGVRSLPFFGFYKNGQKIYSFTGKRSEKAFRDDIERLLL